MDYSIQQQIKDSKISNQKDTIEQLEKEIVQLKTVINRNDMKIKEVRRQLFDIQS